jgi:exosome complex RNA-binding protein Rrp4
VDRARQDLTQSRLQASVTLQKDLASARSEARKDLQEGDGVVAVIKSLARNQNAATTAQVVEYQIVRRQGSVVTTTPATDTTPLRPGDVLQVVAGAQQRGLVATTN